MIRFAKCCNPLPGDEIVGYVTKGRVVSIHRRDCSSINLEEESSTQKLVEVSWDQEADVTKEFEVEIFIKANDRKNLFMEVTKVFSDEKIAVNSVNARKNKDLSATISATIEITSKEQLKTIINKIKKVPDVISVDRG